MMFGKKKIKDLQKSVERCESKITELAYGWSTQVNALMKGKAILIDEEEFTVLNVHPLMLEVHIPKMIPRLVQPISEDGPITIDDSFYENITLDGHEVIDVVVVDKKGNRHKGTTAISALANGELKTQENLFGFSRE